MEWLTTYIKYNQCQIRRAKGNRWTRRVKDGFELEDYIVYFDGKIMWVAPPGYLWDGSSYPSAKTPLGKMLREMVGNRKKYGLLAASAHHDQMRIKSKELFMYYCDKTEVEEWKQAIADDRFGEFIEDKPMKNVYLTVREAASLYWEMIVRWPNSDETVSFIKAFRQYLGLTAFQPWYRLIVPTNTAWEKVEV
jgi:hypothetical protein